MYKQLILAFLCWAIAKPAIAQRKALNKDVENKITSLLSRMTLDEKIGQMNQYSNDKEVTGPINANGNKSKEILEGKVGSMLNVRGTANTRAVQDLAMRSRLKIPILFGLDVVHGYRTIFPLPLAEAASWDLEAIGLSARISATEAASAGVHWTFAPMVDISRDPRWGRVMEGAGEDPYLGSLIAAARVKGFQGNGLGNTDAVMACVKHFAAYGAAIGGRDYNTVDMSDRMLWETYLPPFKSALDAGAATFMNAFNELNGVPATGNTYLQRNILKGKWGFTGFVVSDWQSIGEMIAHGYAKDKSEAAKLAVIAGSDMDMESYAYTSSLKKLVKNKSVDIRIVDDAVRRILRKKFELGLFEDPYRFIDSAREKQTLNNPLHKKAALEIAEKSIVLLKNSNETLPLSKGTKSVALIGPLAKAEKDMLGGWSVYWPDAHASTLFEGLKNKLGKNTTLSYARGCGVTDTSRSGFKEAIAIAQQSEVIIVAAGESADMTGEAKSRSNIQLPGVQEELIRALKKTGKPVIVVIMAGRPLIFNWTAEHADAILYAWFLRTEAGNAIANVLVGDHNPSGKLPMSFPWSEGQIPVFYATKNTGRPLLKETQKGYKSAYRDVPNTPRFSFGYGLSYTSFSLTDLKLQHANKNKKAVIEVSCRLTNTGKYVGAEVVQLYLHDLVASVTRPIMELKDFQKVILRPGESRTINFTIDQEKLSFYNQEMLWGVEPGEFELMIGNASDNISLRSKFMWPPKVGGESNY